MDKEVNISITAGTVVKTLVILALAWLIFEIRGLVLIVLTAIVIASAVEPGIAGLVKRRIPRVLAVIIVYVFLFVAVFFLFYFFVPVLLQDFATFVTSLPSYFDTFTRAGAFDQYAQILGLPQPSAISADTLLNGLRNAFDINAVFGNAVTAATTIFGGVFSTLLIVVFSFYFAVIETGVDDFLKIVTPRKHQKYVLGLWRRSQHKIGLWMQGQLLLGLLLGILVYLGLTVLGIPNALVLAVIAACFEIIPVFGPILAAVPAVMIAFVAGGVTLGLLTIAFYTIAQQFESQLIYPLVVSRVVGVPPLLVILALIIGGELGGFLGIILSVPVAATIQELVRDLESGRLEDHEEKAAKT
jgi:predicted PurR-regulated permease PerM